MLIDLRSLRICRFCYANTALNDETVKVLIWKVLTSFVIMFGGPDSPGHEPDQSRPCLEEEPGAVRVQGEGHADAQQLSGGLLDRKPEEPQPEGTEQPFSTTVVIFHQHFPQRTDEMCCRGKRFCLRGLKKVRRRRMMMKKRQSRGHCYLRTR